MPPLYIQPNIWPNFNLQEQLKNVGTTEPSSIKIAVKGLTAIGFIIIAIR